ncbi:MAG TPA: outer membrane lipoprotein chaperone LolA [Vicinamibacterales bacterium]|nr:outer membrane lipoprotein chaperone LolA [Vicinamibacterales bacterium]
MSLVVVAGAVWAQPASNDGVAHGAATLDAFLGDVHALTAEFRQELWTADQRLLQTETGTLSLRRPNRFRWTYREPTELTVVADGAQLWIYDIELAQVTVAPLDTTVESSPAMLLSGDRSVRDDFDVVQTYTLDGLEWVKLEPKTAGADFRSVQIGFNGTAPQRLELVDGLNQVTRIEFVDLAVNPVIDDAVFEFKPPAGVDVIGDEG